MLMILAFKYESNVSHYRPLSIVHWKIWSTVRSSIGTFISKELLPNIFYENWLFFVYIQPTDTMTKLISVFKELTLWPISGLNNALNI